MITRSQGHDRPLSPSMAEKLGGWSSVARRYPIFGKTWFAYRIRSFIGPMSLLALVLAFIGATSRPSAGLYLTLSTIWFVVALSLTLGRALAVLVCRWKWTAAREATGLACALLFGILVSLSLTPFTRFPDSASQSRATTGHEIESPRKGHLINLFAWLLILAWLGGGLDLLAYIRQRRMLREAELVEEVQRYKDERNEVEMQLSILASQVEPHFLFNTLSGVRSAMLSDPARGIVIIDHLVDYLRATIPQLRFDRARTFVSLGSQLAAAQAYLGVIQARLPRLAIRIECPDELRQVAIPPLMLISLVENAVKHGIELKKGPGLIQIAAVRRKTERSDELEVTVADNGCGFGETTTGSGIGLANIRERLRHLYGGEATLSLRAGEAGGVVASIVLPVRPMPKE